MLLRRLIEFVCLLHFELILRPIAYKFDLQLAIDCLYSIDKRSVQKKQKIASSLRELEQQKRSDTSQINRKHSRNHNRLEPLKTNDEKNGKRINYIFSCV